MAKAEAQERGIMAPVESEPQVANRLAQRIALGDVRAEEELVSRYSQGTFFFLRRRSGRTDVAEDLHQETFRVVIERLRGPGLEEPGRLAGFIRRTAENLFLTHWRRRSRHHATSEDSIAAVADRAPDPLDVALLEEKADLVRRVLAELDPPRDRLLLFRYYLAEEPKENLCRDLGLSSLHFNRVLYRAKQRLRELLERAAKRRRVATWRPNPRPSQINRTETGRRQEVNE